jgi:hypothetical protein
MRFREETAAALANLATATASDCSTLASVTAALAAGNAEIVSQKCQLPKARQHTPFGDGNRFRHGNYCWSHGFRCGKDHTSANCSWPMAGHRKDVTKENKLGGKEKE